MSDIKIIKSYEDSNILIGKSEGGGGGGAGDVIGPSSSTDGNISVFDGATGKIIKDSGVSVSSISNPVITITGNTSLISNRKYICNGTGTVTLTMPTIANQGDKILILSNDSLFEIGMGAGQSIINYAGTATGVSGRINATQLGDYVELTYVSSGTRRMNILNGNITGE